MTFPYYSHPCSTADARSRHRSRPRKRAGTHDPENNLSPTRMPASTSTPATNSSSTSSPWPARTHRPGVLGGIGGFGGLFEIDLARWPRPVLVSGTDGVGTKLKLAIELDRYDTIGIDLVAMCANDVIVAGRRTTVFSGLLRLRQAVRRTAASGDSRHCQRLPAGGRGPARWRDGRTAGHVRGGDFDLAGFCVGIVNRDQIIDGRTSQPGDVILGLGASGPHSNGYSLIRRVVERSREAAGCRREAGGTLGAALLAPTRIYVRSLLALMTSCRIRGLAHITGGGLAGNVMRVLPPAVNAVLHKQRLATARHSSTGCKSEGAIPEDDLLRTFNCGHRHDAGRPPRGRGAGAGTSGAGWRNRHRHRRNYCRHRPGGTARVSGRPAHRRPGIRRRQQPAGDPRPHWHGALGIQIVGVISDRPGVRALVRATRPECRR